MVLQFLGNRLKKCVEICQSIQEKSGKKLKDFKKESENNEEIKNLKEQIKKYASSLLFY